MAYVPEFKNDVFISYAHIDNQMLTEEQRGWIDEFHHALELRLQELLGDKPKIWRDQKLQGNDIFSETLVEQFSNAAVLVSVMSPRYVNSNWCLKELQEFIKSAEGNKGFVIGDKARVFKVLKTLVPRDKQPEEVRGMLGYEFYEIDKATGKPKEFRKDFGPQAFQSFLAILDDLAWQLRLMLESMRNQNGHAQQMPSAKPSGPAIYLAETTSDLKTEREKLKREFEHQGYTILPDKTLPLEGEPFKAAVRAYLSQSKISVHLIGENYGVIPEGEMFSVVHLQNELAAEHSAATAFARLIWLPPGLESSDVRQSEFINLLKNAQEAQAGADLLQVSLEELKTVMQDKLTAKPKPEPTNATATSTSRKRIYLLCDQIDFEATSALEGFLFDQGFEVMLSTFEGDEAEMREAHKTGLTVCDAAIIFYGQASDNWVRTKLLDLIKAPGYGRDKPMLANLVYIAGPDAALKQRFRTHEALVVKNFDKFSPEALQPFLQALTATQ